jgi:hypothetical protein
MGEQFRHLLLVAKRHLDRVVIVVFAILLGAVVYCRSLTPLDPKPIVKPTPKPPEEILPPEIPNSDYIRVTHYRDANPDIASTATTISLLEYNPFNFLNAKNAGEIERENNRKMDEVRALFANGRYQECKNRCLEVLRKEPRIEAQQFIKECDIKLSGGSVTPIPVRTPPSGGGGG